MRRLTLSLALVALAQSASARTPTVADVRNARDLRHALALAKKVPAVRAALSRGEKLVVVKGDPTEREISGGKFQAVNGNTWGLAGASSSVSIARGLFGVPRVIVDFKTLWVFGYDPPGAPALPTTKLTLASLFESLSQQGRAMQDAWVFQWGPWRRFTVPTWRASKKLEQVRGTYPELGPADVARAIESLSR